MSYFPGLKLTKAGEQLLAKVSGNLSETISFRKAELGSGTINSDDEIRFLTALKEKWKDVNISDCKIVGDEQVQVQIELQFDNAGINTNKIFRELGIYAAANDGREVLFAYSNAKENFDYIPAATDNPQSFVINILITITSNTKVNAQIDLNSYVTLRKFNEELAKKLDKGAVSTEYDTAKKIEDKIKTAQSTANNKLDKGTVSAEYNTAAKMEAKIKVAQQTATNAGSTANNKLTKGSLPAGITDAKGIYDLIENNSGLNFDPNLLFLNDAGTKTQDKIYFDRNKKGLFRCTQTTTTTTNSTTYFEDISNKSSADRLANLEEYEDLIFTNVNPKISFKGYRVGNTCTVCISTGGNTSIPAGIIAKVNKFPKTDLYFRIVDNTSAIASITLMKNGDFRCEVTTKTSSGSFGGVLTYSI